MPFSHELFRKAVLFSVERFFFLCISGQKVSLFRFFFENSAQFLPSQAAELSKASLSRILCDSGDGFFNAPLDAFQLTTSANLVSCQQIPSIDLNQWRE